MRKATKRRLDEIITKVETDRMKKKMVDLGLMKVVGSKTVTDKRTGLTTTHSTWRQEEGPDRKMPNSKRRNKILAG
jgi:hypothetical protein